MSKKINLNEKSRLQKVVDLEDLSDLSDCDEEDDPCWGQVISSPADIFVPVPKEEILERRLEDCSGQLKKMKKLRLNTMLQNKPTRIY